MKVCVFCGSGAGNHPTYSAGAVELGQCLVQQGHSLIYGGGKIGLMGILADEVIRLGGEVIGVIPDFLKKREVGHAGITKLIVVNTMHERKQKMADLADAFIVLPGGLGTLDEMAEVLTWNQLGLISKPFGLLNINSYFDLLIMQMGKMVSDGFLDASTLKSINTQISPKKLLDEIGANSV